jgi:hypothetical protein
LTNATSFPTRAVKPLAGPNWVYEIKHYGYRLQVRRAGDQVRLFTRRGYDWSGRCPSNVDTVASVNLSGSDSPSRTSSKILIATSSTTGVPVRSNRAQACRNARFIASRRSRSLNVASPARLAHSGSGDAA